MMANKSTQKIFNNSLFYSLGTVASKAVGFFLVPIYTYSMSKSEYGIATTITTFVSTFGIVVMLSLRAAMIRFYNEYEDLEKPRFIGTIFSFVSFNALLICCLLCIINHIYMPLLFKSVDFFPCVFFGVLSLGTEGVYLTYQSLLQARQEGKRYSVNSMVYLFFHAITVIVFVALVKWGALGIVFSNFVTNTCFALYGVWSMRKSNLMVFCLDKEIIKKSLKYSLPILPHNLANNLNNYSVKIIINRFISYSISGLYTLASQFSTIVNLVQSSVNLAFRPWFIEQMQSGEEGRKQIKYMTCMIMSLFSFCAVTVSVFSKEIVYIMADRSYFNAWKMVPFFVFSQLISFIYYSHVQTLMYNTKMSKFTALCSTSGLLVNVIVSLLLVKNLNVYGILIAQIVSQTVLSVMTVLMSNKAERVDFGLPRMIVSLMMAAVLITLGSVISLNAANKLDFIEIILKMIIAVIAFGVFIIPYFNDYKEFVFGIFGKKKLV